MSTELLREHHWGQFDQDIGQHTLAAEAGGCRYTAGAAQGLQLSDQPSSVSSVTLVGISNLLELSPAPIEAAFWDSASARRLLDTSDIISLTYSVASQVMVLLTGRYKSSFWQFEAVMCMYLCTSVLQLAVMWAWPQLYQRWRFKVTLVNRVLRVITMVWLATLTAGVEARTVLEVPATHGLRLWMSFGRFMFLPCLIMANHANFVLPFRWVLFFQLFTVCFSLSMLARLACFIADTPPLVLFVEKSCVFVRSVMYTLVMVLGAPFEVHDDHRQCQAAQGALRLGLYVYVLLLLLVPCLVVFFTELSMKASFVKAQQQLYLKDVWPMMDSRLIQGVTGYAVLLGSWFVCEGAINALSPVSCSSKGLLVMGWRGLMDRE